MISYAQNFEDVILARCFSGQNNGFYIDVGAGDPVADSVTKHFYDLGWRGINIEPHQGKFDHLAAARSRDINLQVAVSAQAGAATFYERQVWGLSSLNADSETLAAELGEIIKTYQVRTETLANICAQHVGAHAIDFLKVDVEGAERDVIKSMDFKRYPATIVIVEATHPNTQIPNHASWEQLLLGVGYIFVYFDGLNRFYLHTKDLALRSHFDLPPNIFDNFQRQTEVFYQEEAAAAIDGAKAERRRLTSWVEAERRRAASLEERAASLLEKEKEHNLLLISTINQENENRRRIDVLSTWRAIQRQKLFGKVRTQRPFIKYFKYCIRWPLHQITKFRASNRDLLNILERHLGSDGIEILYGRPHVAIDTRALREIKRSAFWRDVVLPLEIGAAGLFDSKFYLEHNPDVREQGLVPLRHYILFGAGEGRNPHPLFDNTWYLTQYLDVVYAGDNPLFHFMNSGGTKVRDPCPLFDSNWYLARYTDVAEAGYNPLTHYVVWGAAEARDPNPFFDAAWYMEQYHEAPDARINPLIHYLVHGADGEYNPSPHFNASVYLKQNPAAALFRLNPLVHYLTRCTVQGRTPAAAVKRAEFHHDATAVSKYSVRYFHNIRHRHSKKSRQLIISISHVFPWPPQAGNEYRIARLLDWFSDNGHDLLIVIAPETDTEPNDTQRDQLFSKYSNVAICYRDGRILASINSVDLSLEGIDGRSVIDNFDRIKQEIGEGAGPIHYLENQFCHEALIGLLVEIDKQAGRAIYYINYAFMTRFLNFLPRVTRSFVDTHDIFSQKSAKVSGFGVKGEIEVSKDQEREMLGRADALLAIHQDDARDLRALVPLKTVISAGVDFSFVDVGRPPTRPSILLVAHKNALNIKGVEDFLRFAWPRIKRVVSGVEFVIVGRVGEAIQTNDPQVKVAGVVGSLERYYRDARVVVNPAVAGTGLKIKTVESVAYCRPIVTWPHGVDGIVQPVLQFCNVAHSWYDFANKTIAQLSDQVEAASSSPNRESIKRELQADVVYAELGLWLNSPH
jgi:FkbM family methyltransferase